MAAPTLAPLSFSPDSKLGTESESESLPKQFGPPLARRFSFSVSAFFNPKDSILGWIAGIGEGRTEREKPLEPARYYGEKHALELNGSQGVHGVDEHRDKRRKTRLAPDKHPNIRRRAYRRLHSSRGIIRTVSNAYRRAISLIHKNDESSATAAGVSPLAGTPLALVQERRHMRFVFVGDTGCGKSSILLRYYRKTFAETLEPTRYELFNKTLQLEDDEIDLELWDTSGKHQLHQLQLLSYLKWDAVFLCFGVDSTKQLNSIQTKWIYEIRMFCRGAPLIIVGTKTDLRVPSGLWSQSMLSGLYTRIAASEGTMVAHQLGAKKYMECSAKTGQGVDNLLEEGVRTVLRERNADETAVKLQREQSGVTISELLCFR